MNFQNKQRSSVDMWCFLVGMPVYADVLHKNGFVSLEDLTHLDAALHRPIIDHRLTQIVEAWHSAGFLRLGIKLSEIRNGKEGFCVKTEAGDNYCKTDKVVQAEKDRIKPQVDALLMCMMENPQ